MGLEDPKWDEGAGLHRGRADEKRAVDREGVPLRGQCAVQGDADPRITNVAEIIRDTQQQFLPDIRARYPDVHIDIEGQSAESKKTGGSLRTSTR